MANEEIVRFFIEEGKEHLDTLEQGLLALPEAVKDAERVNEMFRAAHSVKGGAAMLGFSSIQTVSHRLEDYFKILKENPVKVDRKLENLFLKGLDALRDLMERLQSPDGLQQKDADRVMKEVEPVFGDLKAHLEALAGGGALPADFTAKVLGILKEMLDLFKGEDSTANRKQLQQKCHDLADLAKELDTWKSVLAAAKGTIGNTNIPYRILAPVVIKEIKQASETLDSDPEAKVAPSTSLQQLKKLDAAAWAQTVLISAEPKSAAQTIAKAFNKKQIAQLVQLLQKAV